MWKKRKMRCLKTLPCMAPRKRSSQAHRTTLQLCRRAGGRAGRSLSHLTSTSGAQLRGGILAPASAHALLHMHVCHAISLQTVDVQLLAAGACQIWLFGARWLDERDPADPVSRGHYRVLARVEAERPAPLLLGGPPCLKVGGLCCLSGLQACLALGLTAPGMCCTVDVGK